MYRVRGRSLMEMIIAVTFVGFLVGFVVVLCIGNYYRALRAQERQRQRRLAKLTNANGNGMVDSPRSSRGSSEFSAPPVVDGERVSLLSGLSQRGRPSTSTVTEDFLNIEDGRSGARTLKL